MWRSIQNNLLRLERGMNSNKVRDKRFNLKFTPTNLSTSPLRYPLRVGYHEEPLASPNPHKGRLVLTKRTPQRRGNTNILGCSTQRGHSLAMPNRLEAYFKSNKRKSMNQSRHKIFLWWASDKLSQRSLISHLKGLSHPNPRSNLR
jgi:hypothetical protein